jgi:beta-galactosidase
VPAATVPAATVPAAAGQSTATLSLGPLPDITLWSPDTPKLYTVRATLTAPGQPPHTAEVRTGFREARFTPDGFFLNGERLPLFGLNRHQLFPYLGHAGPARLQRRDAEIIRTELNCTMVRCSHYPQSPHFLDACDELGLLVWAEAPGWQYVGDPDWQDLAAANVHDMIVRDRSRPSVIVWGTRLNETAAHPALYARTGRLARDLDGSRPTAGAMVTQSTEDWAEDVFGYDDYHGRDGVAELLPPLDGVPYLVSEAVGALSGPPTYRWTDPAAALAAQARLHAQVHAIARSDPRYAGLLGWAAIDYASLNGGNRIWAALKTPGVLDTFRVAKPGAALYRSQADPRVRPVLIPVFCWDAELDGPGADAMIATNCDRLEVYAGEHHVATGTPDRERFGALARPPVFVDLSGVRPGPDLSGVRPGPDLRIDGYLGGRLAATVRMSADRARDRLALAADHAQLDADGSDATRITFRAVDEHGNQRLRVAGEVRLSLAGPAVLIGDNPFPLGRYGGAGGAFVRSLPGRAGTVTVTASHSFLGQNALTLQLSPPASSRRLAGNPARGPGYRG